jgi:hypothetical protein
LRFIFDHAKPQPNRPVLLSKICATRKICYIAATSSHRRIGHWSKSNAVDQNCKSIECKHR